MKQNSSPPSILVADDQADVIEALRLLLKREGFRVEAVNSPEAVLESLEKKDFDCLLMDLNYTRDTTSGQEGLDLLERLQETDPTLPVVVMTAWSSVEVAVKAMRRGARDFIEKPWENNRLISLIRTQVELARALRRGRLLEAENRLLKGRERSVFIARSAAMQPVLEVLERVGPSDANVLILGENGTGKGVVAERLHSLSPRANRPMVTVNMGGLPEGVFESELFGHVKGAFTDAKGDRVGRFELADGGTLFLDEITNMTPGEQAKLLRVLERGEFERVGSSRTRRVNVRVFSASNADIHQEVSQGRFRQDLLFRLNTILIHLPPLRRRPEDIPLFAEHFLQQHNLRYHKQIEGFSKNALEALLEYPWPGNVRELDHAVERAVLMARGRWIDAPDLGLQGSPLSPQAWDTLSLEEMEQILIRKALHAYGGNVSQAARALGLSRSALYRRLKKYNLTALSPRGE